jgi:glycosyltransferase involved in cell wall biosynthesis
MKAALSTGRWLKWLRAEIDLCEKFDQVVTMTEPDKQALISYAPNLDIHVVQTAVDSEYFVPQGSHDEEPESIMFLGAFRHYPNVDAVVYFADEILPKIRREKPNVKFYVVGSYGKDAIPRRIQEQDNVIITDWVDDLRPYYERATVLVVPIRLGGGIRGKIQEAWCMHKPVVATPLGADGLEAVDGKNLLIAGEPDAFADAVVQLLRDPARRRALGDAGRETVDGHYSFEAFALKHEAAYYDLLTRRGRLLEPAQGSR